MTNIKLRKELSQTIFYFDLEQGYQKHGSKMILIKFNSTEYASMENIKLVR